MPNDNYEFYLYTKKRHKPFLVTQTHEIQTEQRNKTENEQLKLGSQGLLGSVSVSGFSSIRSPFPASFPGNLFRFFLQAAIPALSTIHQVIYLTRASLSDGSLISPVARDH